MDNQANTYFVITHLALCGSNPISVIYKLLSRKDILFISYDYIQVNCDAMCLSSIYVSFYKWHTNDFRASCAIYHSHAYQIIRLWETRHSSSISDLQTNNKETYLEHFLWYYLIWMPWALTDDYSTFIEVMACCRQKTSHYRRQCWPRSLTWRGLTHVVTVLFIWHVCPVVWLMFKNDIHFVTVIKCAFIVAIVM